MSSGLLGLIDLNSGSVDGAIVATGNDEKVCPRVISAASAPIVLPDPSNLDRFLSTALTATKTVVEELRSSVERSRASLPTEWRCFLAAPFHLSQTRLVRYGEAKPFLVTAKLVNSLAAAERLKFKQAAPQLFPALLNDEAEIIESAIMKIKLDGYDGLTLPYGKLAHTLELTLHFSSSSQGLLERLRETIRASTRVKKLTFSPFSFALFNVFRDLTPSANDSALLVDVDGEVTEVLLVMNDALLETASFPFGSHSLVREAASNLGSVKEEIISNLRLWTTGNQTPAAKIRLEAALRPAQDKWRQGFAELLDQMLDHYLPSNRLFLFGNQALLPLYLEALARLPASSLVIGDQPFAKQVFQDKILENLCQTDPERQATARILIEAIFSGKLSNLVNKKI